MRSMMTLNSAAIRLTDAILGHDELDLEQALKAIAVGRASNFNGLGLYRPILVSANSPKTHQRLECRIGLQARKVRVALNGAAVRKWSNRARRRLGRSPARSIRAARPRPQFSDPRSGGARHGREQNFRGTERVPGGYSFTLNVIAPGKGSCECRLSTATMMARKKIVAAPLNLVGYAIFRPLRNKTGHCWRSPPMLG